MESVGLIQKQKEKVTEYCLRHDLRERPSAFTDLQDDVINSVPNRRKKIWSASFLHKTDSEWMEMIPEED